ncbi:11043_t:CDS:2 [Dentiscutata erythropus]|uniref:11043_t:CDS:1 n=1 Tax=Dentiscutata erythropus TaxID=1348616 RepID=A0A9N9FM97_9GLOM|nr:11043_t:CDS:2 [Dentiscutata erythropus]
MRGQVTYSTFSPRDQIKSKNDNALIINISQLLSSFNEIVSYLYESVGNDIVETKQHLKRGSCSQLEIVFASFGLLRDYATKGKFDNNKITIQNLPLFIQKQQGTLGAEALTYKKCKQDSIETSSINNPGFNRKNKKARTSATEKENLAEIWETSYKNAENKELLQTVGQNSDNTVNIASSSSMQENTAKNKKETVEKTKVAEEENSWFT